MHSTAHNVFAEFRAGGWAKWITRFRPLPDKKLTTTKGNYSTLPSACTDRKTAVIDYRHCTLSRSSSQDQWFTPEEDQLLVTLRASGLRWLEISKRLPRVRTARALAQRAYKLRCATGRNLLAPNIHERQKDKRNKRAWSVEDDQLMMKLKSHGLSFAAISEHFPDRSAGGVEQRHLKLTGLVSRSKVSWTSTENKRLLEYAAKPGRPRWSNALGLFPGRTRLALATHYHHLTRDPKPAPPKAMHNHSWSEAEESKLLHLRNDLGLGWPEIASRAEHGRTINALENHYWHLKRSDRVQSPPPTGYPP